MKMVSYKGKQGIWIRKKYMGIPFFVVEEKIDQYLLKKIDVGYYQLTNAPVWGR